MQVPVAKMIDGNKVVMIVVQPEIKVYAHMDAPMMPAVMIVMSVSR